MNFEPMNFITNLPYMVKGMLGIAVVILIIIGITMLVDHISRPGETGSDESN